MQKVLHINPDKCTGCLQCEMACSFEHHGTFATAKSRIKVFDFHHTGKKVPYTCTQCDEAWCLHACPVEAIKIDAATGAKVVAACCLIDRSGGSAKVGVPLIALALACLVSMIVSFNGYKHGVFRRRIMRIVRRFLLGDIADDLDGLEVLLAAGVRAVVQPGGSRRDQAAIEIADRNGMAMVFTGRRHYRR